MRRYYNFKLTMTIAICELSNFLRVCDIVNQYM